MAAYASDFVADPTNSAAHVPYGSAQIMTLAGPDPALHTIKGDTNTIANLIPNRLLPRGRAGNDRRQTRKTLSGSSSEPLPLSKWDPKLKNALERPLRDPTIDPKRFREYVRCAVRVRMQTPGAEYEDVVECLPGDVKNAVELLEKISSGEPESHREMIQLPIQLRLGGVAWRSVQGAVRITHQPGTTTARASVHTFEQDEALPYKRKIKATAVEKSEGVIEKQNGSTNAAVCPSTDCEPRDAPADKRDNPLILDPDAGKDQSVDVAAPQGQYGSDEKPVPGGCNMCWLLRMNAQSDMLNVKCVVVKTVVIKQESGTEEAHSVATAMTHARDGHTLPPVKPVKETTKTSLQPSTTSTRDNAIPTPEALLGSEELHTFRIINSRVFESYMERSWSPQFASALSRRHGPQLIRIGKHILVERPGAYLAGEDDVSEGPGPQVITDPYATEYFDPKTYALCKIAQDRTVESTLHEIIEPAERVGEPRRYQVVKQVVGVKRRCAYDEDHGRYRKRAS
ncbi:hypothetical protein LTS10_001108 [Elasticomyces elasticus]|nr:hypothetical protein LTS10_001108 [Elasticomyces elasticus]